MTRSIRVGVGGWQFEPWRETFYPATLAKKNELKYASRKLTAIEVNATFYSSFSPDAFARWAEDVPDNFVFSLKAHRSCTVRKTKADMKTSIDIFFGQGLTALKQRLGPINWQFPPTRAFEVAYFDTFLSQLPKEKDKLPLRHALEVRGEGFDTPAFYDLLRKHGASVVYAEDDDFPKLHHADGEFVVARLMQTKPDLAAGYASSEIDRFAALFSGWSKTQDVYAFFISGAKERNPAAAMALLAKLGATPTTGLDADALAAPPGAANKKRVQQTTPSRSAPPSKPTNRRMANKPKQKKTVVKSRALKK